MTTYSLSGFAAVFDLDQETVVSVADVTMDFVWFDGAAASLRYDYTGSSLAATVTTANAVDAAIDGALSLDGLGLSSSDEVFSISWDQNGVTRETSILARWIEGVDLDGVAPGYAVFGVFALDGDALPPISTEAYFARFMLTQIDSTSYEVPTGDLAPSQSIDLGALGSVTVSQTDHVTGTDIAEVLSAGSGADTLLGKGGDDSLRGQNGDDLISGGEGDDTLNGGNGVDTLSYLDEVGSSGVTVSLETGTATDTHGDSDEVSGFEGVQGSWNEDTIVGDSADNQLVGFGGADSLVGGDGHDSLTGGAGDDTLSGGGNIDLADYSSDGGASGINADLRVNLVVDTHGDTDHLAGIDQVNGTKYGDRIIGGYGNTTLKGSGGADTLVGASGHENLFGGAGGDRVSGDAGNDTLQGGDGVDTLSYAAETGTLGIVLDVRAQIVSDTHGDADTFAEFEVYEGSEQGDTLQAAASGSQMLGAGGNDQLFGQEGQDSVEGGAGRDTLSGDAGADTIDGGSETDTVDYSRETGTGAIQADLGLGTITDTHGDEDQVSGVENVIGTDRNDLIRGDDLANLLAGGDNHDQLYGMGGADSLQGGQGDDTIGAGDGNDTLRGGAGSDLLGGGNDDDWITGDDGNDFLRAGPGDDSLEGGEGIDALTGSYGDDTLLGGGGNDSLAGSYGADQLNGQAGHDEIGGGDQNDTLEGASGNDTLAGGSGHDLLIGGSDDDQISDGWGRDTVDAGVGDDTINAGPDPDRFTGGGGADVFVFPTTARADTDTITDFEVGTDVLQVAGYDGVSVVPTVIDWTDGVESGVELQFGLLSIRLLGHTATIDLDDVFGV